MVLLVLVGSALFIQAPAYGWHNFFRAHLVEKGGSGTFSIETDCPANSTFVLRSPIFNLAPANEKGFVRLKVSPNSKEIGRSPAGPILSFRFKTEKLSSQARGTATFTATCNGENLSVGKGYSGQSMQRLPMTGGRALLLLALGLGLVLAGGVLIALGRTGGSSPSRS